MKKLSFLIVALLGLSFMGVAQNARNVNVKGTIVNVPKSVKKIYLKEYSREQALIDSAVLGTKGEFSFNTKLNKGKYFYVLSLDAEKYLPLILFNGDAVEISSDFKNLTEKVNVKGSKESEIMLNGLKKIDPIDKALNILNEDYSRIAKTGNQDELALLEVRYDSVSTLKENVVRDIVRAHKESISSLMFLGALNFEGNLELYQKLDSALYPKYSDMEYINSIHRKVQNASKLAIGAIAPEIELANPEGKMIKLSSLRGQYVMVDFWASWCGPCRKENPNVVRIYNQYHAKGFDVFGVSLDKSKDKWVQAIKADGLTWPQVSDLQGWTSVAAQDYNIESIPNTILLDKEGRIIAKGLRGEELEAKLKELLGE